MNVDSNLDSTNKIIDLLERKLSFMSNSTSSHNSVIITKNPEAKSEISSNVLNYIKNNSQIKNEFDTNNLFQQREKLINDDDQYFTDDDQDDEENPYDLLIASPPRSPPREVDPDRLYGLYDFNGPDPSHCNIKRDEPVLLINDDDNYWWLIKKINNSSEKIGFAPAECLETYGERLARLNCFKNEELEKSNKNSLFINKISKKNSKNVTFEKLNLSSDDEDYEYIDSTVIENIDPEEQANPIDPDAEEEEEDKLSEVLSDIYPTEPLLVAKNLKSKFGSLTRYSNKQKSSQQKKFKSHTPPPIRKQKFDEIEDIDEINNVTDIDQFGKFDRFDNQSEIEGESVVSTYDYNQPTSITNNNNYTLSSIGSFSPDTDLDSSPQFQTEERFTNSLVINRVGDLLNKQVKYDGQLNITDNENDNDNDSNSTNDTINMEEKSNLTPENYPLKSPMSIRSMKLLDDLINEEEFHINDTIELIDTKLDDSRNASSSRNEFREYDDIQKKMKKSKNENIHNKTLSNLSSTSSYNTNNSNQSLNNVTPLTSTNSINLSLNSLNSINSDNSTIKNIDYKFNELFNPILSKFDELSEKLVNLEKLIELN